MSDLRVVRVGASRVRPLRHRVLRSGRPEGESCYPADDLPGTLHLAVVDEADDVVCCGTFFPEPYRNQAEAWRLRGMATDPEVRGRGLGSALMVEALTRLAARGVPVLWCNARVPALEFYRRFGFATEGDEFEVAGVPHLVALLDLATWCSRNGSDS